MLKGEWAQPELTRPVLERLHTELFQKTVVLKRRSQHPLADFQTNNPSSSRSAVAGCSPQQAIQFHERGPACGPPSRSARWCRAEAPRRTFL